MSEIFVSYITLDFRGGDSKSRATTVGILVYMTKRGTRWHRSLNNITFRVPVMQYKGEGKGEVVCGAFTSSAPQAQMHLK